MYEHEQHGQNPLKAGLGDFMEKIVSGEQLDPDRVVAAGRGRQRRRRAGVVAGSTLMVLAVAGSVYALRPGGGTAASPASGGTGTHAKVSVAPSSTKAVPPASLLPGKVLSSGTTGGVAWKISAKLDGYVNGNTLPQFCVYVWTSTGLTDPTTCVSTVQPDAPDPQSPSVPETGFQTESISGGLGLVAIYTSHVTKVHLSYRGGSRDLAPVDLGKQVVVTAAILPISGGTETATGPVGSSSQPVTFGSVAGG